MTSNKKRKNRKILAAKASKAKDSKGSENERQPLFIGDNRMLKLPAFEEMKEVKEASYGFSYRSILITSIIVMAIAGLIIYSLYKTQIKEHDAIAAEASQQYYLKSLGLPLRGDIYDRNGVKLAGSTFVYRVGITPKHLESRSREVSAEEIQEKLSEILELPIEEIKEAAAQTDATYIQLKKDLVFERGKELEAYMIDHQVGGIRLDAEPRRMYFNGDLASQVIGFTSTEGQLLEGRLGIELAFDDVLRGDSGFSYGARMNYGADSEMPFTQSSILEKHDGNSLYITIDLGVQEILQRRLADACVRYDAMEDGMAIAMDPYTGEIYGMASYPYFKSSEPLAAPSNFTDREWEEFKVKADKTFQVPEYPKKEDGSEPTMEELVEWEASQRKMNYLSSNVWRNKAISDTYEAGSTFKTITAAIGLEENLTHEEKMYNDAKIQVLDYWISCHSGEHGHGYESMELAFVRSCNPVFVQIALATGIEKYYEYIDAFGFRDPTGLGLPGEAACMFHENPSLIDLATLSFGEQSPVTAIHMMRAYAALVNGGKLVEPTIVKEVRDRAGHLVEEEGVKVTRQVISEETSARIRELLRKMVASSTRWTNSGGYEVGGKTSTSTDEATGYNTVSFMEAAPISHPRLLVMFILQRPSNQAIGGIEAQVEVMEATSEILEYMNIDRDLTEDQRYLAAVPQTMPNLFGLTYEQANEQCKWLRIPLRMSDKMTKNSIISYQIPAEGTEIYPGNAAYVFDVGFPELEQVKLPDFYGKNIHECITAANRAGLIVKFEGDVSGVCIAQRGIYKLDDGTEMIVEETGGELPLGSIVHLAFGSVNGED